MNAKYFEQIKSYVHLIVYELHKTIFDEEIFDKLKDTLLLAEELECYLMEVDRKKNELPENSNVIPINKFHMKHRTIGNDSK